MFNPRPQELKWYRKHGKYPERIIKDSDGLDYVIGDQWWNLKNPDKLEFVELKWMMDT